MEHGSARLERAREMVYRGGCGLSLMLSTHKLLPDWDRGWSAVAVAGQCVDGSRSAGDLRRDAAHEGFADGAADQQNGPQRCARDRADDASWSVQAGACEDTACPAAAHAVDQP